MKRKGENKTSKQNEKDADEELKVVSVLEGIGRIGIP